MSRISQGARKLVPVPSPNKIPERDIDKSPILECQHLGIDFGGLTAVNDFNMAIGRTEIAGLIGPNGAGKTTVFNLLTKVYQPTRGTILLDGVDTHNMNTVQVNKAGIARTFQNIRLFNNLTRGGQREDRPAQPHRLRHAGAASSACPATGRRRRWPTSGPWSCCPSLTCRIWPSQGGLPALRRPAPAGDRPGPGHQPLPAAAGRAGGGHEPLRDRRAHGEHREDPGHLPASPSCSSSTT